jgi:hypothetical protein
MGSHDEPEACGRGATEELPDSGPASPTGLAGRPARAPSTGPTPALLAGQVLADHLEELVHVAGEVVELTIHAADRLLYGAQTLFVQGEPCFEVLHPSCPAWGLGRSCWASLLWRVLLLVLLLLLLLLLRLR